MKGTTLLETLIVIALIAILSTFGVNSINSFKKEAVVDNATNELVSMIKVARSKSMNGEVPESNKEEIFDAKGWPEYVYGIEVLSDKYALIRKCINEDRSVCGEERLENIDIGEDLAIVPTGRFYFEKITGKMGSKTLEISDKNGKNKRLINISDDFVVSVTRN